MKLYISCFTSDFEIMQEKWALKRLGRLLSASQAERYENQKGAILEYSWDDETLTEVVVQDCPFGMCTVGEKLFVCDAKLNKIIIYHASTLEKIDEITSPLFNDIHSVVQDGDTLLIASSGIDTVLRLSLSDYSMEPIVSFVASDNSSGLAVSSARLDATVDYGALHINTEQQATHLNYAAPLPDNTLGISLFHQDGLVSHKDGEVSFIIRDLYRPHAFFEYDHQLYVADSGNHCVKVYTLPDYTFIQEIPFDGWVQDIKRIDTGGKSLMFASDADNSLIRVYDLAQNRLIHTIQLPKKYRISSCELKLL